MHPKLRRPPRANLVLWILIAVMFVLIVISIFIRRPADVVAERPEKAYPVVLAAAEPAPFTDLITLPGRVLPFYRAHLPSVKPGQVAELHAERGDTVTNGQLLLRLDARLWEAALAAAELEQKEAGLESRRWHDLQAAGAVSESDMDRIRNRKERADIMVREAWTHLSQCEVRSPVDGVINERYIERGEYATEGMAVFEIVVTDPIKVRVDVPERDAGAAGLNPSALFRSSVLPGHVFTGAVVFTASAAPAANNAFAMEIEADNRDGLLKPGMIVEVEYRRGTITQALTVPLDAIIPRNGEHIVFVAQDGRAVRRTIRIDRIAGDEALVADGLRAGDLVVIKGNRGLEDGVRLTPVAAEGSPRTEAP